MTQIEKPELIIRQITTEGFIEQLVREGRTPLFTNMSDGQRKRIGIWIPSKGTQSGDSYGWVGGGGGYGIYSPQGELRGLAQLIDVDLETGRYLEARVDAARQALYNPLGPQNP